MLADSRLKDSRDSKDNKDSRDKDLEPACRQAVLAVVKCRL
jgi:hypothetical protein